LIFVSNSEAARDGPAAPSRSEQLNIAAIRGRFDEGNAGIGLILVLFRKTLVKPDANRILRVTNFLFLDEW
jgi:hypothetical protein